MMRTKFLYINIIGILLIGATTSISYGKLKTVYVKNSGFESVDLNHNLSHWKASSKVYSIDKSQAYSGDSSLHYHNSSSDVYKLCSQTVSLDPKLQYELSAWAKKPNGRNGARLIVEFHDKYGNYLHGTSKSSNTVKSKKWKKLSTGYFILPKKADPENVRITCYVPRGGTGDAWFDNVLMTSKPKPTLGGVALYKPNYRGRIEQGKGSIEIRGWTNSNIKSKAIATAYLTDDWGNVVSTNNINLYSDSKFSLTVPSKNIDVGKYRLEFFTSNNTNGKPKYSRSWTINVVENSTSKPKVYIDDNQRLIANGKPMFPIGIYSHMSSKGRKNEVKEDIDLLKGTAFNTILPYGIPNTEALSYAQKNGIYFIASVKSRKDFPEKARKKRGEKIGEGPVPQLKNEPALLAWYVNDESGLQAIPRLKAQYNWVKQLDPNHPAYSVTDKPRILNKYMGTFDVVGSDPYPIPGSVAPVTRSVKTVINEIVSSRPIWEVIQVFNWKNYGRKKGQTPSPKEVRNMVWQSITHGANGIILYSLYDIRGRVSYSGHYAWRGGNADRPFKTYWPKVKKIAAELNQWAPVLLSIEPSPEIKTVTNNDDDSWLSVRIATWHGRTFVFASNNTRKTHKANFHSSSAIKHVRSINVLDKKHKNIEAHNNTWQDTFKPLDVKMYELNGTGKKLPPPQDIHPPKDK